MMKKIVLLGAGAQGAPGASVLARLEIAEEIVLADGNEELLDRVCAKIASPRITPRVVNAADVENLTEVFRGADAVINLINPMFNQHVMRACLAAHAHYVDTSIGETMDLDLTASDNTISRLLLGKELPFSREFKEAGLSCVIGCGSSPGLTNIVGRYLCDKLDTVDSVKFSFGRRSLVPENPDTPWAPTWAPARALWGYSVKPYVYKDGAFEEMPRYSGYEEVSFHEPVGSIPLTYHHHPEQFSFPYFYDKPLSYCDFKFHIDPKVRTFIAAGLADPATRVNIGGQDVCPRDVLVRLAKQPVGGFFIENEETLSKPLTALCGAGAEVVGTKDGRKVWCKATFSPTFYNTAEERVGLLKRFGASNIYVSFPAIVGAILCTEGNAETGVIGAECLDPYLFFQKMAELGLPLPLHETVYTMPVF